MASVTKTVYAVYTNSDLTEGRGHEFVKVVCELQATALRLAKGQYVMGTDAPVRPIEVVSHDGRWYFPADAVEVVNPTREDIAAQDLLDATAAALDRARKAGLSPTDIALIRKSKQ